MNKKVDLQDVIDLLTDKWDRTTREHESVFRGRLCDILDAVRALAKEEWTPLEKDLPMTRDYVLLSFANFDVPLIGRCRPDEHGVPTFYAGDDLNKLPGIMIVNAWMPLPKCYRRETDGADEKLQGM